MTKAKSQRVESSDRDFAGIQGQHLVSYLQACTPNGTLERVLALAGETRTVAALGDASTWSSYAQFRRLLEATGHVLGGSAALFEVGKHVYDSIQSPEFSEALAALKSPHAVYASVPSFMGAIVPAIKWETESIGPAEIKMSIQLRDGKESFPELCAFEFGMCGITPTAFGYPYAEITIESCQCDGADFCQACMHWEEVDDDAARASRSELRYRLAEARLEEIQHSVAELVSGDELETVLNRVAGAAARAVSASSYVLDIKATASTDQVLYCQGIDSVEGARILDELIDGPTTDTAPYICVVDVASDRRSYGHLVAMRAESSTFETLEHAVLESYARLAASALDSAVVMAESRQQATSSGTAYVVQFAG
jgi:hypothetical protein